MHVGVQVSVVACALMLVHTASVDKKYSLTVGYLPALTGEMRSRQGLTISGAISLALEELNNSTVILPDVKILLEWHDTKSWQMASIREVTDMCCGGVVAFFGPEEHCYTEAMIAESRNLPMLSYKCADPATSLLKNFVRLDPSPVEAMKPVISLLRYYRWNKFSILYENSWSIPAQVLSTNAEQRNMTVNHQLLVQSFDEFDGQHTSNYWYHIIKDTKDRTRIYVYLGSVSGLRNMMSAMESHDLFNAGQYMVIYVDMTPIMSEFSLKYFLDRFDYFFSWPNNTEEFRKRTQSLLVVSSSQTPDNYEEFANQVRKHNREEPFKFPEIEGIKKFISIHAAYLYDSVKIYANALDELIKEDTEEATLSNHQLMNIAHNGSRIVAKIIKGSPYTSVSGLPIRLNERGESEGQYSVLAFKMSLFQNGDSQGHFHHPSVASCSLAMVPVGHFQRNDDETYIYKITPRTLIDWADNVKPEDEPACGFLKQKCPHL